MVLDLRTITPYSKQAFIIAVVVMAITANRPEVVLPALVLLSASVTASYPFQISENADLETLYAVLPLTRRALLLGHFLYALATYVAYAIVGSLEALISAHVQNKSFSGHDLAAVLAISWALFALNIAIKFSLFVRFGYSQIGMLGTTVPIALVAAIVSRTHVSMPSTSWLGVFAAGGVALFALSIGVALGLDPRRVRRPEPLALT
jgi:hypothetical protein